MLKSITCLIGILLCGTGAADALRCGSSVVSEGDHKVEVLKKCGEPDFADTRVIYETFHVDSEGRRHLLPSPETLPSGDRQYFLGELRKVTQPVYIDEWTYNFGSHRLMRHLEFVDGKLRKIKTLGYGR